MLKFNTRHCQVAGMPHDDAMATSTRATPGRDLRQEILRTALALLNESGVSALSMREVARRAGVTHQAPYHHFGDRESILAELAAQGFEELTRRLTQAHALAASDLRAAVIASGRAYIDFALSHPGVFRIMFRPETCDPARFPAVQAAGDAAQATLIELVDAGCSLVLTTGGTGPALRDVTPEATLAVAHKEMPGFGEQMRQISLAFVPTAILSRQVAVVRSQSLIINLPGQPKAIAETLEGLKNADGTQRINGIFAAVPYCIDLIGGPYLETNDEVCKAFRPKSAVRPAR